MKSAVENALGLTYTGMFEIDLILIEGVLLLHLGISLNFVIFYAESSVLERNKFLIHSIDQSKYLNL